MAMTGPGKRLLESNKEAAPAKDSLKQLLEYPEVESWRALMEAFRVIYRQLENALLLEDCSIPRFQILFYLYFEGPLSASAIAKKLFVTRGNMSMFLKRLVADGLIQPSYSGTSRGRPLYCLTKKGIHQFEDLFPRHIGRVRKLMLPLEPELIRALRQVLSHAVSQETT